MKMTDFKELIVVDEEGAQKRDAIKQRAKDEIKALEQPTGPTGERYGMKPVLTLPETPPAIKPRSAVTDCEVYRYILSLKNDKKLIYHPDDVKRGKPEDGCGLPLTTFGINNGWLVRLTTANGVHLIEPNDILLDKMMPAITEGDTITRPVVLVDMSYHASSKPFLVALYVDVLRGGSVRYPANSYRFETYDEAFRHCGRLREEQRQALNDPCPVGLEIARSVINGDLKTQVGEIGHWYTMHAKTIALGNGFFRIVHADDAEQAAKNWKRNKQIKWNEPIVKVSGSSYWFFVKDRYLTEYDVDGFNENNETYTHHDSFYRIANFCWGKTAGYSFSNSFKPKYRAKYDGQENDWLSTILRDRSAPGTVYSELRFYFHAVIIGRETVLLTRNVATALAVSKHIKEKSGAATIDSKLLIASLDADDKLFYALTKEPFSVGERITASKNYGKIHRNLNGVGETYWGNNFNIAKPYSIILMNDVKNASNNRFYAGEVLICKTHMQAYGRFAADVGHPCIPDLEDLNPDDYQVIL